MIVGKDLRRQKIRYRIRKKVSGTAARPRLSIFRSNRFIYAQLIDDLKGHTLIASSSSEFVANSTMSKVEEARQTGKKLAEKALAAGISNVVFDRGGYLYHGRVKSLADGAREGGLIF